MTAFIFPGQGSQHVGMGGDLFDEIDEFRLMEDAIDDVLGFSVRTLCLSDPEGRLKETRYTQPALFVVNALHYYKLIASGRVPTVLAGHSLGEFNALCASGVFSFLTGLRLVKKRGELMGQVKDGGMAAVIGLDSSRIETILADGGLDELDVANFNSPLQTVLSGSLKQIDAAAEIFDRAGASAFIPLPVSAAFHSRYMAPPAAEFDRYLQGLALGAPKIPVIANVTAQPYDLNGVPGGVRGYLVRQITGSVRWADTIRMMRAQGQTDFLEVGPGNVLSRLLMQFKD